MTDLDDMPEIEEFDIDEWKLLAMMLVENRAKLNLMESLAPFGQRILMSLRRKIAIRVLGIDLSDPDSPKRPSDVPHCPICLQPGYGTEAAAIIAEWHDGSNEPVLRRKQVAEGT